MQFILLALISDAVNKFIVNVFHGLYALETSGEIPLSSELSRKLVRDRED